MEASDNSYGFLTPGSPWVTSDGTNNAIVWVLVANVLRTDSLVGPNVSHPILYALDPVTLKALWTSTPTMLNVGGKYNAPAFGRGMVFVATDRIQAFGLASNSGTFTPIRVNCGGPAYTDSLGQAWSADNGFSAGNVWSTTAGIAGTADPALYQDERWNTGAFQYQFAAPAGSYTVTLKYAEIYFTSAGQRVFNVTINGTTVKSNFDVVAAAGGANKAIDQTFTVTSSGTITIQFTPVVNNPTISAIQIAQ